MDELECVNLKKYLLDKAGSYLKIIKEEYGQYMSVEQKELYNSLFTYDCIEVDMSDEKYLDNQKNSNLETPLAHGGRVFGDNKIHFYPCAVLSKNSNLSYDEVQQRCEEVLIHELMHFFIRPDNLDISDNLNLTDINRYTTEGLVDMCARDICQKYGLFPNYKYDNSEYVVFMREALSNIDNVDERMWLVFNGSIEEIYNKTTTFDYDSREKFISVRDKKSNFDLMVTNLSSICFANRLESGKRAIYNYCANLKNKEEIISGLEQMRQMSPDKQDLISQAIDSYKVSENISVENNESLSDSEKQSSEKSMSESNGTTLSL